MKMKRNRLLAFLLVCAIGVTCGACGKSGDSSTSAKDKDSSSAADNSSANDGDSAETNVNQANSEDVQKMLEQNQKLQMSDYDLSSGNSNVPVNEGANQGAGNSSDSENSSVIVTDDSGATVTDDSGKAVTQKVSGGNSSDSNSTTTSGGSSSKSTTGCKQLYWLDTSQGGDFYPDGDFVDITFKIKDDAKDGNYTLGFSSGGDASQFANYDAEDVAVTYVDGDIAVGSASQKQEGSAGSGCTLIAGTAKGNQGDEVTVRYSISNCPGICAMILRVTYDTSALEVTGYEVGSGAGDIEKLES